LKKVANLQVMKFIKQKMVPRDHPRIDNGQRSPYIGYEYSTCCFGDFSKS